ncbi:MAG TPA: cytochrome c oxidase subunit 3 [Acidimicrobiales bacterium]|nr:cytochrome c oxidase subunit 3 [Acidimicrobiales bacterium]
MDTAAPAPAHGPSGRERDGDRTPVLTVGTVVWLASELMFFSGLFAAYFTLRATADGDWPPSDVELEILTSGLFTLGLVLSSGTMQLAVRAIARGRLPAFRGWLVATLVLAAAFIGNQAHEWSSLEFHADTHSYGSAFYVMTGFHGIHVIGGMLAMVLLLGRAGSRRFGAGELPAVEMVSYYWHFVDVVWIGLWATLFLLK